MADIFSDIRAPRMRARLPAGGNAGQAIVVVSGPKDGALRTTNEIPCTEWSITDDVLNVADSASFAVPNIDGEHTGKFHLGQRVEIDEYDPDVAAGRWVRQFTGRVVSIDNGSAFGGGSTILVTCMDLGWHLTSSAGPPLFNTEHGTIDRLLKGFINGKGEHVVGLVDPSWGFSGTSLSGPNVTAGNALNRQLKQGRLGVTRLLAPSLGAVLPYIQVEPGQTPWDVLQTYAQREGLLLNVGAKGDLILFRPSYETDSPYESLFYYASTDKRNTKNNVKERPGLRESIEGVYSESQCWSTAVNVQLTDTADPNAQFRHDTYTPENPLPFNRRMVFMDSEAITETMRLRRARWRYQMALFGSWEYSAVVPRHSSGGVFYTSDSMIGVEDTVNGVPSGSYYVQAVRRSVSMRGGVVTQMTIRKPGLIDPDLQAQIGGGGVMALRGNGSVTQTVNRDGTVTTTAVPKVVK